MILEELKQPNAVLLDLRFQLVKEAVYLLLSLEALQLTLVSCLLGGFFKSIAGGEWVAVVDELHVLDFVLVRSVDGHQRVELFVLHGEAKVGEGLSELLRGHLEMLVSIPVLEEALRVESVPLEPLAERVDDALSDSSLIV